MKDVCMLCYNLYGYLIPRLPRIDTEPLRLLIEDSLYDDESEDGSEDYNDADAEKTEPLGAANKTEDADPASKTPDVAEALSKAADAEKAASSSLLFDGQFEEENVSRSRRALGMNKSYIKIFF
jgi:hypothetical protein